MKKNLIKKVFAVSLSIAMACSFLPAANPVTASAAAPYVSLKTTFKTIKVGASYKMTLKNNTINWKIKKVETTDKTIATVYGKTTSQVMIKGKSVGRATIRVRLATTKRKTNNTKTLRCRANIVAATPVVDPTTPVQTDATVTTQAELDAALKDSNITKITIKPTTAVDFVIPKATYSNVDLIVDAPQSDIENSATFKSITINDIKAETWTEKGIGNKISLLAKKAVRLIVDKEARVSNITVGTTDAKVNLVVNGGTIDGVNVTAKAELNITGTTADTALVPVVFGAGAADSVFTTEIPVAVTMSASIELIFEKGAVKSTVKLEVTGIKATITNRTPEAIVVTKNDNTPQSVPAGAVKSAVNATSGTSVPVTPGTSNGSSSTVTKPATTTRVVTGTSLSVVVSGATTGTALTVSESAIKVATDGVITTASSLEVSNNAVVQYTITASTSDWTKTVTTGDMQSYICNDSGRRIHYIKAQNLSINGAPVGKEITLTISFRVKETDANAASPSVKGTCKIKAQAGNNAGIITVSEWSWSE